MSDEGYRKLDIYQLSRELAIKIHAMTLELPKFELFEEGSQIRRSSKSITTNIVEGYCLRKHKNEFLQYLQRSYGSTEETIQHLDFLSSTKSLRDEKLYNELLTSYTQLSKMIFRFMRSVEESHDTPFYVKEQSTDYVVGSNLQSQIHNPQSSEP